MRVRLLILFGLASFLCGGSCSFPLVPTNTSPTTTGFTLGIAVLMPDASRTVGEGTVVAINWTASNVTGQPATVSVLAESRVNLARTTLLKDQPLSGEGGSGTVSWNTTGFSGLYQLYADITAGNQFQEASAPGQITVQPRATFEFTAPPGNVEFALGSTTPLTVSWIGSATKATAVVGLDPDTDHTNGNEIVIADPNLTPTPAAGSLAWLGKDTNGNGVLPGVYNLFASVIDNVNPELLVDGAGQITVVQPPPQFTFTAPAAPVELQLDANSPVTISWNASAVGATTRIEIDSDTDPNNGNEITIDEPNLPTTLSPGSFDWNGRDPNGTNVAPNTYNLRAVVDDGINPVLIVNGLATITVFHQRPQFTFTAPTGPATFQLGSTTPLTISWTGSADGATTKIELDPDTDPNNGNSILIDEPNLPLTPGTGSFDWTGKDTSGTNVAPNTYNLRATVNDNVNPVLIANGLGQITVQPAAPTTPQILEPSTDVNFLIGDPNALTIEYRINSKSDALVDIKIDTDNDHTDGNERTILSQEFVKGGTDPNSFAWNGTDVADPNVPVPPGIYRIYLSVSTGAAPSTTDANNLVYRQIDPNQPLIALLAPTTTTRVSIGGNVFIQWRDYDPAANATIRLVVANTPIPADHVSDPNALQILSGRPAAGDGVLNTFNWQVQASPLLEPNTPYFVIAYIQNQDAGLLSSDSVAAGRVIVNDPNSP